MRQFVASTQHSLLHPHNTGAAHASATSVSPMQQVTPVLPMKGVQRTETHQGGCTPHAAKPPQIHVAGRHPCVQPLPSAFSTLHPNDPSAFHTSGLGGGPGRPSQSTPAHPTQYTPHHSHLKRPTIPPMWEPPPLPHQPQTHLQKLGRPDFGVCVTGQHFRHLSGGSHGLSFRYAADRRATGLAGKHG